MCSGAASGGGPGSGQHNAGICASGLGLVPARQTQFLQWCPAWEMACEGKRWVLALPRMGAELCCQEGKAGGAPSAPRWCLQEHRFLLGCGPTGASSWGSLWIWGVLESDWCLSPQAYNIHVNGVLHCRVRYSQLLGLHEQVGSHPQWWWELLSSSPCPVGSTVVPAVLLVGRVLGPAGCCWVLQEGTM